MLFASHLAEIKAVESSFRSMNGLLKWESLRENASSFVAAQLMTLLGKANIKRENRDRLLEGTETFRSCAIHCACLVVSLRPDERPSRRNELRSYEARRGMFKRLWDL